MPIAARPITAIPMAQVLKKSTLEMSRSEKMALMKKQQLKKKVPPPPKPLKTPATIPEPISLGIIDEETDEEVLEPLAKRSRKEASSPVLPSGPTQQVKSQSGGSHSSDQLASAPSAPSSSNRAKPRTLWPQNPSDPFPYDLLERFVMPADNDRFKNHSPDQYLEDFTRLQLQVRHHFIPSRFFI